MADNSNPTYMEDLDFARHNYVSDEPEYMGQTVYSLTDRDRVISEMEWQGWILYMSKRLI